MPIRGGCCSGSGGERGTVLSLICPLNQSMSTLAGLAQWVDSFLYLPAQLREPCPVFTAYLAGMVGSYVCYLH